MSESRKTRADGSLSLRVDLQPEIVKLLFEIMDDRALLKYAEAVRYCIKEASEATEFKLEEGYWKKINELLLYDYIKNKYRLSNAQSFVNKALDTLIEKMERDNQSILSFDVRDQLTVNEVDIAISLIERQEKNATRMVTLEELADEMDKRNISGMREILESFVERGILSKNIHQGETYYHAKPV